MVRDTLIDAGHAVGVVGDGESALKVLRARKPDLIILDAGLPEMSGIEVLSYIRRDLELYSIPVLMLTGRRSAQDERIAFNTGATDYLTKPFEPEVLAETISDLLKQHTRPEEAPGKRPAG